jgi:hypothetical protein
MPRVIPFCLPLLAIMLCAAASAAAQTLTVMELLQSPRQFVERRVSVRGYYHCDFEGAVLFADRVAANRRDYSRSVWVDSEPAVKSELRPAEIIGVFQYSSKPEYGHFGLWPAQIINATIHLRREATPAPNQAMERTADRCMLHF